MEAAQDVTPTCVHVNKEQLVVRTKFLALLFFALAILTLGLCVMQLAYFNMRGVCYSRVKLPFSPSYDAASEESDS